MHPANTSKCTRLYPATRSATPQFDGAIASTLYPYEKGAQEHATAAHPMRLVSVPTCASNASNPPALRFPSPAPYFPNAQTLRQMRRRDDLSTRRRLLVRRSPSSTVAAKFRIYRLPLPRLPPRKNKSRRNLSPRRLIQIHFNYLSPLLTSKRCGCPTLVVCGWVLGLFS